jgi:uncharacterized protein YegJ (DUF2314 family)
MRIPALAALLLGIACAAAPVAQSQQDHTVVFANEDAEMNAAVAHARETLPRFWAAFDAKAGDEFSLKVSVPFDGGHEHIWVSDIRRSSDHVDARYADEPEHLPGQHAGDALRFTEDQISDWVVQRSGRTYGFFTTRVIFAHMEPAERATYASIEQTLTDDLP